MRLNLTLTVLADLGDPHLMAVLAYGAQHSMAAIAVIQFRREWMASGWGGLCWVGRG